MREPQPSTGELCIEWTLCGEGCGDCTLSQPDAFPGSIDELMSWIQTVSDWWQNSRRPNFLQMQSLSALLLAQSSSPRPSRSAPPWCWLKHECCWDFLWACLTRWRIARRTGWTSLVPAGPSDCRRGMCPQTPRPQRVWAGVDSSSLWWCVAWRDVCCAERGVLLRKEVFRELDAGQGAPFFGQV